MTYLGQLFITEIPLYIYLFLDFFSSAECLSGTVFFSRHLSTYILLIHKWDITKTEQL